MKIFSHTVTAPRNIIIIIIIFIIIFTTTMALNLSVCVFVCNLSSSPAINGTVGNLDAQIPLNSAYRETTGLTK